MKKALVLLIGLALAFGVGLSVYRAMSRFAPVPDEEWTGIERTVSSSSSSPDVNLDGMIRWEDIESSIDGDATVGISSSSH